MGVERLVAEQVFSYQVSKDNKLFIYYLNKQIMIVKGEKAQKLLKKLEKATLEEEQLVLAKVTGKFKRGNEKLADNKGKRKK